MSVAFDLIIQKKIEDRGDLSSFLESPKELQGFTGKWMLQDGVWLKDLVLNKITKGEVETIN
jgi:hypothetical protein